MKKIILLIVSIVLVVHPAFARDVLIVSGHPEYPPIMWKENGAIVGVAAELAKASNRMNIDNYQPFFNQNVSINTVVKGCKI